MKQIFIVTILLVSLSQMLVSCKDTNIPISEGTQILFPEQLVFTQYASDTVAYTIPSDVPYKVVVYVDSTGCTDCKLELFRWQKLMEHIDTLKSRHIPFLFFFQPKQENIELEYLLRGYEFDTPVCVDTDNRFGKLNSFSTDSIPLAFLLDADNRVVVMGNPVFNRRINELYLEKLCE